ncbi:hypothetical protein DSM106972_038250 [Dulcicalothrix desertica PCC 7102]|uniref:Uncharacterized protein n=1 Tax=Dulcicalothrix desertica PCC 7102 TaxID=232991 RepID=A0A433VFY1_9CYAN|nr:hypothetical protein [Dulcicalothrix desertica]RUT05004.1 hypothetical protein DSM106972_038250 [Dulcicalothrix desertica PCC 7102]TWH43431.1 hypothetical protein CAL7102_07151 [Dulcicalothrix desertica PCC 7102]
MLKNIVYFITKKLPEYMGLKLQRKKKSEAQKQGENWIEDFDERERDCL